MRTRPTCPICNKKYFAGDKFCSIGGTALVDAATPTCQHCDSTINAQDKFCTHCGHELTGSESSKKLTYVHENVVAGVKNSSGFNFRNKFEKRGTDNEVRQRVQLSHPRDSSPDWHTANHERIWQDSPIVHRTTRANWPFFSPSFGTPLV